MQITTISTPLMTSGGDLLALFTESVAQPVQSGDIVCVVSKVVALAQGRLVDLAQVQPSPAAMAHSPRHPALAELVLQEADLVLGGQDGAFFLTLKDGLLVANAGVDRSNVPAGYAILGPTQPWRWAEDFCARLRAHYAIEDVGVIITDSHLTPLRRGVMGIALAWAGFEGIESQIGQADLYGVPLAVTEKAVADDLASATVLLTGEGAERTPFALVRGAPARFTHRRIDPHEPRIAAHVDLYAPLYAQGMRQP